MKKSTKKFKRIFALFLVVLTSINSFAAVVSDNDGSAFITKAEFDSLKNNFQSQIDAYNSQIDNKIDSAISQYLAGIKTDRNVIQDILLNKINAVSTDGIDVSGTWTNLGYRAMAKSLNTPTTRKAVGAITNFLMVRSMSSTVGSMRGTAIARLGLNQQYRGAIGDVYRPSTDQYKTGIYVVCDTDGTNYYSLNKITEVTYRYWIGLGFAQAIYGHTDFPLTAAQRGAFVWETDPFEISDGQWCIKRQPVTCYWGTSTDKRGESSPEAVFGPTYEQNEQMLTMPILGQVNDWAFCLLEDNYPNMILENTYDTFYGYESRIVHVKENGNFDNNVIANGMQAAYDTVDSLMKIKYNHHPVSEEPLSSFVDYANYNALGTSVKIYNGIPVFKATDNGKAKFKIKFYSVNGNNVYVGLSKNKFSNNANDYYIDTSFNLKNAEDVLYNSNLFESNKEYTFVLDVKKGETVWIRTFDANDNFGFTGATIVGDIELKVEG